MSTWDPARTAEFFDEYGEREWTRFEDGRTPGPSLTTHTRMLEGYVRPGDRVLDAGSGPGRFTLELLRLGAHVTALDISPGQLELLRARVPDVEAVVGDINDLSRFPDDTLEVVRTGVLPQGDGYGHLPMRMYLWEELEELLAPHGEVVEGAEKIAYDPGSRSCGEHIIGVLRVA